ncbi:MAG: hypothetical protein ABIP51_04170 [Bacteroidia bacterium]
MKKILVFLLIVVSTINVFSQPFFGGNISNLGLGVNAGYQLHLSNQEDEDERTISGSSLIATGGMLHNGSAENPQIFYYTLGYVLSSSNKDAINLTLSFGEAFQSRTDFTKYNIPGSDRDGTEMKKINKNYFISKAEISKDINAGRFFIEVSHTDRYFYGIGARYFLFNSNKKL